jgi:hypothetical protein
MIRMRGSSAAEAAALMLKLLHNLRYSVRIG